MLALLVDDSKVVRTVTASILKDLSINSEEAENGKIALEMVMKKTYDFIVLDWNMPVMTGPEFMDAAKEILQKTNTKVIFCTTETELDKISVAISKGAAEYIMKPYNKEIVKGKLEMLGLIAIAE
jgi:two-component system chemotaxis response regulator CheY